MVTSQVLSSPVASIYSGCGGVKLLRPGSPLPHREAVDDMTRRAHYLYRYSAAWLYASGQE